MGDQLEKKRASTAAKKTPKRSQEINIITYQVAGSFYDITGIFFGLFRQRAKDKFLPLTQANIIEIHKKQDNWLKMTVIVPYQFICISTDHIEAVTIK